MLFTSEQIDLLKELINIGVGKAAALFNNMVKSHIELSVPDIKVNQLKDIDRDIKNLKGQNLSAVKLGFRGNFSGVTEIVFPNKSAINLVSLLTGEDSDSSNLDDLRAGTLNEVANMLLNSVMGVLANLLNTHFQYDIPTYSEDTIENLLKINEDENQIILLAETHFVIKNLDIEGDILILLELSAYEHLKEKLDSLLV